MAYIAYFEAPNPGQVGVNPGGQIVGGVTVYASGPATVEEVVVVTLKDDAPFGSECKLKHEEGGYYWTDTGDTRLCPKTL